MIKKIQDNQENPEAHWNQENVEISGYLWLKKTLKCLKSFWKSRNSLKNQNPPENLRTKQMPGTLRTRPGTLENLITWLGTPKTLRTRQRPEVYLENLKGQLNVWSISLSWVIKILKFEDGLVSGFNQETLQNFQVNVVASDWLRLNKSTVKRETVLPSACFQQQLQN